MWALCTLWLLWKNYNSMVPNVSQLLTKTKTFNLNQSLTCAGFGIFVATCVICHEQYAGQTSNKFSKRWSAHRSNWKHGRNFVVKCGGDSLVRSQYSHRVGAELTFYIYRFPILFLDVVWEQRQSRFALSLQMIYIFNMPKFVAGHGTAVQPASINIVFGCTQPQQHSRAHRLSFIRAVSWSAQNAESRWSHVHVTLVVEHFSFHACSECCLCGGNGNGNGLLFHMTQPISRSTIKAIACSKPTICEH